MKIIVAREAGFCMGVKRALELVVERASRGENEVFTWGPLIHNPQVVQLLESHRVNSSRDLGDLKPGKMAFISAHGISPVVRQQLKDTGATVCDASCPDVVKVQAAIRKYATRGYDTVIFGDSGHTEVKGLLGYAQGRGYVVGTEDEVDKLPALKKVLLVSQTTRPQAEYDLVAQRLQGRFNQVIVAQTICASTRKRQAELARMLERVEAMVVVGGKNSANTARLSSIARQKGIPVFQVETAEDLPVEKLAEYRTVGVTAGASTPNWLIQGVVETLKEDRRAHWTPGWWVFRLVRFLVKSNALVALGASFLTIFTMAVMGIPFSFPPILFAFLATQSLYTLNIFADPKALMINAPYRHRFYRRRRNWLLFWAGGEVLLALFLSIAVGWPSSILALLVFSGGALYAFPLLPGKGTKKKRFKDSPQFRELTSALGWLAVTGIFPLVTASRIDRLQAAPLVFIFILVISLIRSILFGVRDLQGDRLLGRGTMAVQLGRKRSKLLIFLLLGVLIVTAGVYDIYTGKIFAPEFAIYLVAGYVLVYLYLYHRRIVFEGLIQEVLVDFQFILAGLLALIPFLWGRGYF